MTALQWIVKEAKAIKKAYPKRFAKWTDYVAQASAIYAKKHKGKSPVGKKHAKKVVRKKAAKKKVSGVKDSVAIKKELAKKGLKMPHGYTTLKRKRKLSGLGKIAKYKIGQKVYSYQNKDYSAPIIKTIFSPWDNTGVSNKYDTYKYKLNLKNGESNWIDEKSISKKRLSYLGKVRKKKISEQSILNRIHKVKHDVERLDEAQHKHMIGALSSHLIHELKEAHNKLMNWQKILHGLEFEKKKYPGSARIINVDIKRVKEAIKEQKTHIAQLKKNIK